ncbi:sulfite exporter TauE/SafE family protein [Marinobacterium sedimentorum]|uniref:sulfite exporter TauE/SafE family protein n=1 Tax=Marinobacterium sedimentorum TaxID=2927804 RepID=UPI0020C66BD3|nr:sulfite exporter TauE/SafE family protein [Marinobacterium sedimentorum]MCP8688424.1 sulfite exporter TauE/SafE family protein [Marinobacterium sedimentorum]
MDLTLLCVLAAGLITGFSKFSVGGMGLLILPVLMIAVTGPEALAILVPMYVATDLMAIAMYRRDISWAVLVALLPPALIGVVLGTWLLGNLDTSVFTPMLGGLILAMIALGLWLDHRPAGIMRHPLAANITGLAAGFISMVANAAGPLFSLYLLEQRLSKDAYVSTRAWGFMIINGAKLPMLWTLGLITQDSLRLSLYGLPALILGASIGYWLLRRLKLAQFKWLIRIMASLAAIKLFAFS